MEQNSLVRVLRHPDDTVTIFVASPKARREISRTPDEDTDKPDIVVMETDAELIDRTATKYANEVGIADLEYVDVLRDSLPANRIDREKWRWQAGGQGIRVAAEVVTRAEARQLLEDQLDAELAKASPSPIVAMRLQRKLDKREF